MLRDVLGHAKHETSTRRNFKSDGLAEAHPVEFSLKHTIHYE